MELQILPDLLTVCRLSSADQTDRNTEFYFLAKTDEEISLVCRTEDTPDSTIAREDGWRGFRIRGVLDFSLIGILSGLTGILAENGIGLFAVSTFNTDYILVKSEQFDRAVRVLADAGYKISAVPV